MTAFEKMSLRAGATGNTIREQMIYNSRASVEALIGDDPSYKTAEILGKGMLELRMNSRRLVQGSVSQMEFQSVLNNEVSFNLGDILKYDGDYWVCVEAYNMDDIYRRGKIEECNYLLRWQNPYTLEIHERWCSARSPYSSGLDEDRTLSTGNAKLDMTLPYDEETRLFHKDFRFLIDVSNNRPMPFKIVRFDGVTNRYVSRQEGFLEIKVEEDQLQDDDRWDLMIANYKEPSPASVEPVGLCSIEYDGEPMLRVRGTFKTFEAKFYDENGVELSDIEADWELILPPELGGDNKVVYLKNNQNEIKIKAASGATIGSTFVLRMTATSIDYGDFEAELTVRLEGLL